ncbi:CoaE Dephospho-CoA kinase [Microbacteriaceae bacterium]
MFLVGLTGGIASGKSTVAAMLSKFDNEIIDADEIAREVVLPGSNGLSMVVAEFGPQILEEDGSLSRAELAKLVFEDPEKRLALEGILHPLIRARTLERISQTKSDIVIYIVPLLVEAKVDYPFDLVVTIEAGSDIQFKRLVENRGMSTEDATARIAAQATEPERVARADVRIDGALDLNDLDTKVSKLWNQIQALAEAKAHYGKN